MPLCVVPCVLDNGLTLRLHSAPDLKQAAAYLRVHAGSHDVPHAWPGLAHFLEHLFFLGTERFAGDEGLMAFVQRQGGQINARTSERHTDYFFQVPPQALEDGLTRLCDMLGHLRLGMAEQLREREVLHAEFIAWSRDAQARHEAWLTAPVSAAHPLRGFHAGNRYSLPVHRASFQHGVRDFYQRFYQAGQMTLVLAGPQSLEALRALAPRCSAPLPSGRRVQQQPPPPLRLGAPPAPLPIDPQRLNLVFAGEHLPPGVVPALELIGQCMNDEQPGGLLHALREQGWVQSLRLNPHYVYAGQALIDLELRLTEAGHSAREQVATQVFDWLAFFAAHPHNAELLADYTQLQAWRLRASPALERARFLTQAPHVPALAQVLATLQPVNCLHPVAAMRAKPRPWKLPPRNPLLTAGDPSQQAATAGPPLRYIAHDGELASLHLRWWLPDGAQPLLWQAFDQALQAPLALARQAGVQGRFTAAANSWLLTLNGLRHLLPRALPLLLESLTSSPSAPSPPPPLMPIRELLKRLPDLATPLGQAVSAQALWPSTRWDGLALGFDAPTRQALDAALSAMPGQPAKQQPPPRHAQAGRRWHRLHLPTTEHALLLFCPVPQPGLHAEATWRWLGHYCQMSFYQRHRVELQLGYAVFSDLRNVGGRTGLLFGVQSPATHETALAAHIEDFINALPQRIAELPAQRMAQHGAELAGRFASDAMELPVLAEHLWMGHTPQALQQAIQALSQADLVHAAEHLAQAAGGWEVLATGAAPADRWLIITDPAKAFPADLTIQSIKI